jgi:CheY-like chemotaxis protein
MATDMTATQELPRLPLTAAQPLVLGPVLLAEDNPVNQAVATGMLESLGCRVTVVATGREAVAAFARAAYDVVLMDMQMPEMDGLAATRVMREREAHSGSRRTPIIALTANAFAQDQQTCLAAGMDDFLSKPFTLGQLRTMLGRWKAPQTAASSAAPAAIHDTPPNGSPSVALQTLALQQPPPLDPKPLAALRALQKPGGPDVLEKVLRAYLDSAPQLLATLREALACSAAAAVQRAAHSLKSSSANVGAMTLAAHCKELEAMGRAKTLATAPTVFGHIEAAYALVEVALTAELHASPDLPQPRGSTAITGDIQSHSLEPDTVVFSLTDPEA